MKILPALLLLALVLPAAAQPKTDDEKTGDVSELKKKYAGKQQQAAGGDVRQVVKQAIEKNDENAPKVPEGGALRSSSVLNLRPALKARYARGVDGWNPKRLSESLGATAENISELVGYIRPWKQGVPAPTGDDLAWAQKELARESKAAADLIKDGDLLVAKGIPRDPLPPPGSLTRARRLWLYPSMPVLAFRNPTEEEKAMTLALLRGNVAGHLASVVGLKTENPPLTEDEAKAEGWLAESRKSLAEHDQKR